MANGLIEKIEGMIRHFLAKLGAALDRKKNRSHVDLGAIITQIEEEIERQLRKDGDRLIAPNVIELRLNYESYSQMTNAQLNHLCRELKSNLTEYVHNRRYTLIEDMQVIASFDPFTRKPLVKVSFSNESGAKQISGTKVTELWTTRYRIALHVLGAQQLGELQAMLSGDAASVSLGRSHDNTFVIYDHTVSKFHASFTLTPDCEIWLADLGSSNGTFINNVPVDKHDRTRVRNGDRLRFGDVEVTIEIAINK